MITKPWDYKGRAIVPNNTWRKWSILRATDSVCVATFPTKRMCREHIDKLNGPNKARDSRE